MTILKRSLLFFLAFLLVACNTPLAAPLTVAEPAGQQQEPTPTVMNLIFYQVPADATPTATPFMPIPPTAVYVPTDIPTATPLPTATPEPTEELAPPADQINILLLGSDARNRGKIFRTDTIILASINPGLGTVNLLSFPRDLYITIPGYGPDRINTAWQRGGFDKLAATLRENFGIRVDHYVLINFENFKRIVDGLGGLEVEVGEPVSDYYRGRWTNIKQGVKQMNADMVLWYVRTRKTTNDFARNRRQQEVLLAMARKFLSIDAVTKAPELYNFYKGSVTTDLGLDDMLPLLPMAAQLGEPGRVHSYYISPKMVYDWITPGGAMVLLPRRDAILKTVRKTLSGR